jgi:hypothetical protein
VRSRPDPVYRMPGNRLGKPVDARLRRSSPPLALRLEHRAASRPRGRRPSTIAERLLVGGEKTRPAPLRFFPGEFFGAPIDLLMAEQPSGSRFGATSIDRNSNNSRKNSARHCGTEAQQANPWWSVLRQRRENYNHPTSTTTIWWCSLMVSLLTSSI